MFSTSGSHWAESTGSLREYWSSGTLAPDDMRAVDKERSVIFGAVAGVSVDGRLFRSASTCSQAMTAISGSVPTDLPTVRFDDQELARTSAERRPPDMRLSSSRANPSSSGAPTVELAEP